MFKYNYHITKENRLQKFFSDLWSPSSEGASARIDAADMISIVSPDLLVDFLKPANHLRLGGQP